MIFDKRGSYHEYWPTILKENSYQGEIDQYLSTIFLFGLYDQNSWTTWPIYLKLIGWEHSRQSWVFKLVLSSTFNLIVKSVFQ